MHSHESESVIIGSVCLNASLVYGKGSVGCQSDIGKRSVVVMNPERSVLRIGSHSIEMLGYASTVGSCMVTIGVVTSTSKQHSVLHNAIIHIRTCLLLHCSIGSNCGDIVFLCSHQSFVHPEQPVESIRSQLIPFVRVGKILAHVALDYFFVCGYVNNAVVYAQVLHLLLQRISIGDSGVRHVHHHNTKAGGKICKIAVREDIVDGLVVRERLVVIVRDVGDVEFLTKQVDIAIAVHNDKTLGSSVPRDKLDVGIAQSVVAVHRCDALV